MLGLFGELGSEKLDVPCSGLCQPDVVLAARATLPRQRGAGARDSAFELGLDRRGDGLGCGTHLAHRAEVRVSTLERPTFTIGLDEVDAVAFDESEALVAALGLATRALVRSKVDLEAPPTKVRVARYDACDRGRASLLPPRLKAFDTAAGAADEAVHGIEFSIRVKGDDTRGLDGLDHGTLERALVAWRLVALFARRCAQSVGAFLARRIDRLRFNGAAAAVKLSGLEAVDQPLVLDLGCRHDSSELGFTGRPIGATRHSSKVGDVLG